MPTDQTIPKPRLLRPAPRWTMVVTVLLLMVTAWSFIISGNESGRGAWDDLNYHWPAIQIFAQQLPTPDLSDYPIALTPGYHLNLAVAHRLGASRMLIQIIASFWSIALFGILAYRSGGAYGKLGLLLMLPMFASMHAFFPAIWLLPDNAGWCGVLIVLILAMDHPQTPRRLIIRTTLTAGVVLALLVLIRQIHIWVAATVWIAAWSGTESHSPPIAKPFSDWTARWKRLTIALVSTIPAVLILAYFVRLWGGLVPPSFQNHHQGPNIATPAFILMQLAILSVFFAPILLPRLMSSFRAHWYWYVGALVMGLIAGIYPESSYSTDQGRYSGWWNLIRVLPTIGERSPIIMLGAPAGAVAAVIWSTMISRRDRWIMMTTLLAFIAAQSANHASWQRYHEPMLLMMGILILTRSSYAMSVPRRSLGGAIALSLMLASISVPALISAKPFDMIKAESETQNTPQTP